jgi:hypothetical protein
MIADITNTVGLVLLKNRSGWIFISDSMRNILVGNRIDNENFSNYKEKKSLPFSTISLKYLKIKRVCCFFMQRIYFFRNIRNRNKKRGGGLPITAFHSILAACNEIQMDQPFYNDPKWFIFAFLIFLN